MHKDVGEPLVITVADQRLGGAKKIHLVYARLDRPAVQAQNAARRREVDVDIKLIEPHHAASIRTDHIIGGIAGVLRNADPVGDQDAAAADRGISGRRIDPVKDLVATGRVDDPVRDQQVTAVDIDILLRRCLQHAAGDKQNTSVDTQARAVLDAAVVRHHIRSAGDHQRPRRSLKRAEQIDLVGPRVQHDRPVAGLLKSRIGLRAHDHTVDRLGCGRGVQGSCGTVRDPERAVRVQRV